MSNSREVVLGVGGGIAAYKSCDLLRRLLECNYRVTVVPTPSSLNFVGAATWEALSGRTVTTQVFEDVEKVRHISLANDADFFLIAPATADLIARIAAGRADDLLTNLLLATKAPVVLAPAMHPSMWLNRATQENVALLRKRGLTVIEPDNGPLTGSDSGVGRLPSTARIIKEFEAAVGVRKDLLGKRVLVTAGGTREAIDPVRFIGNRSSGKQGYAIAKAALRRGAEVELILANSDLPDLVGVKMVRVERADQMLNYVEAAFLETDILVMAAAVADARPSHAQGSKIKKDSFHRIELVENVDILKSLSILKTGQVIVAFAAETDLDMEAAQAKLVAKKADLLYLNDVSGGAIFGSELTMGQILVHQGPSIEVGETTKDTLADLLLDQAALKLG